MDFIGRVFYDLTQAHPIHTLIVHFPIALVSAALFFILLALWRHSDALEQVAFANIALAAVSTVVAGITGMLDNIRYFQGGAPNAPVKIVLAGILFAITAIMSVARWRNPGLFHSMPQKIYYIAGYVVSFLLVATLGFLGGVILYGF